MKPIESVKAHFALYKRRRVEVPQWAQEDGTPLVLYSDPMTLADKQKVRGYLEEHGDVIGLVHLLILKARTEDGKPVFTLDDKHALVHKADPDVIARIAREITRPPRIEELEKN